MKFIFNRLTKKDVEEIEQEIEKFIKEEFINYKVFTSLALKFNNKETIKAIMLRNLLTILNSYDVALQQKHKLMSLPLNTTLYSVNPYTNKEIFNVEFKIEEENNEFLMLVEINPKEKKDECLFFTLETQLKMFNNFFSDEIIQDFKKTIIDSLKLNFSKSLEAINEIAKMAKSKDFEKLDLNTDLDLYLKEIAYSLDQYKMPEIYERVKNENHS